MKMTKDDVKKILPHREPMLLVDTVEEMTLGESIVTTFHVAEDWDIFRGHFPTEPVLPGVYSVECMAQAADVLLLSDAKYAGKLPLFIGINNVSFRSKIRPGDTITVHARITAERVEKAIITCAAQVYNGETLAAVGDVTLAMR